MGQHRSAAPNPMFSLIEGMGVKTINGSSCTVVLIILDFFIPSTFSERLQGSLLWMVGCLINVEVYVTACAF